MNEKRKFGRYSFECEVEINRGHGETLSGRVLEVGADAMFVEILRPFLIGETFMAHLMLDPPLQMICYVNRIQPGRGVAVQVVFASKDHDQRFVELVDGLAAMETDKSWRA
jgi:hypothetical protein